MRFNLSVFGVKFLFCDSKKTLDYNNHLGSQNQLI